jgi:hypothetical protein
MLLACTLISGGKELFLAKYSKQLGGVMILATKRQHGIGQVSFLLAMGHQDLSMFAPICSEPQLLHTR